MNERKRKLIRKKRERKSEMTMAVQGHLFILWIGASAYFLYNYRPTLRLVGSIKRWLNRI